MAISFRKDVQSEGRNTGNIGILSLCVLAYTVLHIHILTNIHDCIHPCIHT